MGHPEILYSGRGDARLCELKGVCFAFISQHILFGGYH